MLTKILLTALVVLGAVLVLRRRTRQVQQVQAAPAPAEEKFRLSYAAAYSLLAVMLAGAGFFLYLEWEDNYRVVDVRVVDSRSGNTTHYQARRGDVDGRSFRTLDGREITLADVERMELGAE